MPEAVIVSAARSPIGRANKGSLKDLRPDDLTALDHPGRAGQGPRASTPRRSTTSTSAAACPAASRATTWPASSTCCSASTRCPARRSPATARPRCRPPGWRSTRSRPARATSFISAGVETVSRFAKGTSDHSPDTHNPLFDEAEARTDEHAKGGQDWHDPREDGAAPRRLHRDGPDRRERRPAARPRPQGARRVRRPLAEPRREGDRRRLLGPRDHPGHHARRHGRVSKDDGPRAGVTYEAISQLDPVFRPDGVVTAGNCCALNDGAAAVVIMSDTKAAELGLTPLARIVSTGVSRPLPRDHGPRPGRGHQAARWPTPA